MLQIFRYAFTLAMDLFDRGEGPLSLDQEPASVYQTAILNLKTLKVPDHRVFKDISQVEVIEPNIVKYYQTINNALHILENEVSRTTALVSRPPVVQCLKDFFITEESKYIRPDTMFPRFVDVACELLDLYERKLNNGNLSPRLERIILVVLPIVNNLVYLSEALHSEDVIFSE